MLSLSRVGGRRGHGSIVAEGGGPGSGGVTRPRNYVGGKSVHGFGRGKVGGSRGGEGRV